MKLVHNHEVFCESPLINLKVEFTKEAWVLLLRRLVGYKLYSMKDDVQGDICEKYLSIFGIVIYPRKYRAMIALPPDILIWISLKPVDISLMHMKELIWQGPETAPTMAD